MTIGVYKITERETGKCYIGQSKNIEKRWNIHQRKRFPILDFDYKILQATSVEQLNETEIRFIDFFDSHRNGFNKTIGGTDIKVRFPSKETLAKISKSLKGKPSPRKGITMAEEIKQKMSEAKKGKPSTRKGKTHSKETRQKISEAMIGKPFSKEHKQKMSESSKARWARKANEKLEDFLCK